MKSKIIFFIHLIIKTFRLENIVIKVCEILNIKKWKALPQNLLYKNDDNIKINKNNIIFKVNRNDFTQWQIYADYPELHFESFLRNRNKGNVIDVGANIGSFSLKVANYYKNNNKNNKVICFEPYLKIYKKLIENINLNENLKNNLIVENIALGSNKNKKYIFKIVEKNLGANYLVIADDNKNHNSENIVMTSTLDNYCLSNRINNISFIKIDVEGMELDVLNGSLNILKKYRPDIFIEINEKKYNEKNTSFELFLRLFNKEKRNFFYENKVNGQLEKKSFEEVLSLINSKEYFNLLIS